MVVRRLDSCGGGQSSDWTELWGGQGSETTGLNCGGSQGY